MSPLAPFRFMQGQVHHIIAGRTPDRPEKQPLTGQVYIIAGRTPGCPEKQPLAGQVHIIAARTPGRPKKYPLTGQEDKDRSTLSPQGRRVAQRNIPSSARQMVSYCKFHVIMLYCIHEYRLQYKDHKRNFATKNM